MRVPIKELYNKAYGNFAIGAFNVFNAEQVHGVFKGALKAKSPVIIQLTPIARNYMHQEMLEGMIAAAENIYPGVVFTVHLDHGNPEHCIKAIESGYYQSVMIDASHEPYDENVRITRIIVKSAHKSGISVEAELGVLSGVEGNVSDDEKRALYTNPEDVFDFVSRTNCDSLAVAVGTSHGAYKFFGSGGLQLQILEAIQKKLPRFPLVLHGASSVPREEVGRINMAGGNISSDAKGVRDEELLKAIKLGVAKINIATDMRLIWTRVHREFFRDNPEQFDMIIPGLEYINALESFVSAKCIFLNGNKNI